MRLLSRLRSLPRLVWTGLGRLGGWLREPVARLAALAAVIAAVKSALEFRPVKLMEIEAGFRDADPTTRFADLAAFEWHRVDAVGWALLGGGLLLLALALTRRRPVLPVPVARRPAPAPFGWRILALGAVALLVLGESNASWPGDGPLAHLSTHLQAALFVAGFALAITWAAGPPGVWLEARLAAAIRPLVQPLARRVPGRDRLRRTLDRLRNRIRPRERLHAARDRFAARLRSTLARLPRPNPPAPQPGNPSNPGHAPAPTPTPASCPGARRAHSWREVWPVVLITLVAFGVRTWNLTEALHVFIDEVNFSNSIRWFWIESDRPVLLPITGTVAFPRIYPYFQGQAAAVLGRDLLALRIISAVCGALTVPALYRLARHLFDRPTALIAAALLATYPPHVHFSRIGINNIADPLFGTLALMFLASGLRSGRRTDYALAGVMLGLTQYFYEGGRVAFPVIVVTWLAAMTLAGWGRRLPWRELLLAGGVALLVAVPVYHTLRAHDLPTLARRETVGYDEEYLRDLLTLDRETLEAHEWHFKETWLALVQLPEGSLFYGGDTPLLLIYLVPPVLLGTAVLLSRWRAPGPQVTLLWAAAAPVGSWFVTGPPGAARYVISFPALMLVAAVGLRHVSRLVLGNFRLPRVRLGVSVRLEAISAQAQLEIGPDRAGIVLGGALGRRRLESWAGLRAPPVAVLLAALALALMGLQAHYYFGAHLDSANYHLRHMRGSPDGEDAMFRSRDFPPDTRIHIISEVIYDRNYAQGIIDYLADDLIVKTLTPAELDALYLATLPRNVDHAFFLEPGDAESLNAIYRVFPLLGPPELTPYEGVPFDKQLVLYYAPRVGR